MLPWLQLFSAVCDIGTHCARIKLVHWVRCFLWTRPRVHHLSWSSAAATRFSYLGYAVLHNACSKFLRDRFLPLKLISPFCQILGIDSAFCNVEAFVTGVVDNWPHKLRKHRKAFVTVIVLLLFLLGLPMVTEVSKNMDIMPTVTLYN